MKINRRLLLLASAVVAVVFVAAAYARFSDNPSKATSRLTAGTNPSPPGIDVEHPFVDGLNVPSTSVAAARTALLPVAPASLGAAAAIYIHDPAAVPASGQAIAFVYHSSQYGPFVAIEDNTQESQSELDTLATSCDPAAGCEGTWKVVTLSNGTEALLISGDASTGLMWIRNGHRFDVYGPPATFTVASAESAASRFASAAP